jgi:MoxR-like ATPase
MVPIEKEFMATQTLERETLLEIATLALDLRREVGRAFLGGADQVELILVTLLSRGHVLIEGVPGVAKTTLVRAFAAALGCSFRRLQFTPDLLPSDITGTLVPGSRPGEFMLREGPIFSQIVLADEINRAPAKTQSALLEAMQERQVTIEGETRLLPQPFLVLATQNPSEHEGTYPLPEAQLDRFSARVKVGYPTRDAEREMLRRFAGEPAADHAVRRVLEPARVLHLQELVEGVHVDDEIYDYVLGIGHFTRHHPHVHLGASPRACLQLLLASKARALLSSRDFVLPDDVRALATAFLPHRLQLAFEPALDEASADSVVKQALAEVPYRRPSIERR